MIVVIGTVAGFQITEWGERQKLRDLAAQNLSRAIAETQYNYELLGQITEHLERELVVFDTVLDRLLECDTPLTQNEIEEIATYKITINEWSGKRKDEAKDFPGAIDFHKSVK